MLREIPIRPNIPYFELNTVLDGVTYILIFRLNTAMNRFILGIKSANNDIIIDGIPVLNGVGITDQYSNIPGMPQGRLNVIDESGKSRSPDLTNFGQSIKLIYQGSA